MSLTTGLFLLVGAALLYFRSTEHLCIRSVKFRHALVCYFIGLFLVLIAVYLFTSISTISIKMTERNSFADTFMNALDAIRIANWLEFTSNGFLFISFVKVFSAIRESQLALPDSENFEAVIQFFKTAVAKSKEMEAFSVSKNSAFLRFDYQDPFIQHLQDRFQKIIEKYTYEGMLEQHKRELLTDFEQDLNDPDYYSKYSESSL